jgi:hypothetical protein
VEQWVSTRVLTIPCTERSPGADALQRPLVDAMTDVSSISSTLLLVNSWHDERARHRTPDAQKPPV